MDALFDWFYIIFAVVSAVILGLFFKAFYDWFTEKRYNDSQPILTKTAIVTGKRMNVNGNTRYSSVSTDYYATFEFFGDKNRLELVVSSDDYGMLAENDAGNLTLQGRRYLKFERT